MKHVTILFLIGLIMGCSPLNSITLPGNCTKGSPVGPIPADPPGGTGGFPTIIVAPAYNFAPMYINGVGGGSAAIFTPPNSSEATQWEIIATGGGAGATRGCGGGGAGGTVVIGITNLPPDSEMLFHLGRAGLGSDSAGGDGLSHNGGDTTLEYQGITLFTAMGGLTAGNSLGGGPGGDPFQNTLNSLYIITGSGHMVAGGDGEAWNGVEGIGGSSYWGGVNFGGSGGGEGAGGGSNGNTGWDGASGLVIIRRLNN